MSSSIRSRGSLRERLVKPKDKLDPEEKTGVVYVGSCAGANNSPCCGRYVGETGRTLKARVDEHLSTTFRAPGQYASAVMQHARDNDHHVRKNDFKILTIDEDWFSCGVRESMYIRALDPTINDHPGRHLLPRLYDDLIKANIKQPIAPAVHDPNAEEMLNSAPKRPGRPRKANPNSTETIPKQTTSQISQQQQQQHPMQTRRRALITGAAAGTPG